MKVQTARILAGCTLFIFSQLAWGQQGGSPTAYVSGTGGVILSVDTSTGAATTLVSNSNAAYEGLVVGPDNVASDNPTHAFLLYACDPTHNTIIRLDPNDTAAGIETVYAGGALQQPQCGRFSGADLILTSKVAGSGVWRIAGAANIALGAGGFPAPVQNPPDGAFSSTQVSQGIAQKNIGDLLIVDSANRQVIRSQYGITPAFSGPPTVFIPTSSLLPGPLGIARKSVGDIYISNQSKNTNSIVHFNAQGASGSTCVSFSKKTAPFFMQMSADDTLYVATSSTNSGALYSVNTGTCVATQVPGTLPPLVGVALPPTFVTQGPTTFTGTETFDFGFTAYQFTSPAPGCTLTVQAAPTNLAVINSLISPLIGPNLPFPDGALPAVNLGWDGFEIAFNVSNPSGFCTPQFSDGTNDQLLGAQLDNLLVSNPRIVACDTTSTTTCGVMSSYGSYPLGGLLPGDGTYSGHGNLSEHFLVSGNLSSSEPGTFCGFESPLSSVAPPGIAGTFGSGQTVSTKFKLAQASGTCQNGPFITNAVALLSVAQIFDSSGNPVFNPIAIGSSGSSTPAPPVFKLDSNKQYQFSLSLQGYAAGTYSLTVTFLTSNTVQQTIEFQVQ